MEANIVWLKCEGEVIKYVDRETGLPRRCTQNLLRYNANKVSLAALMTQVEGKCPRCGTIYGGRGFVPLPPKQTC